jgi:hypothetical protein
VSAPALSLPLESATVLVQLDVERIRREQQATNRWAIQKFHDEGGLRRFAEAALRTAPPTRTVEFWEGDAAALKRALIALGDITLLIQVLIDADAITDVGADAIIDRLTLIRCALVRFLP